MPPNIWIRPNAKRPDTPAAANTEPAAAPPSKTEQSALRPSLPASGPQPDIAFGAYQRGEYLLAFKEATKRASEQGDPVAMTLLGELYSNGYGVPKDEKKANAWFSLAADRVWPGRLEPGRGLGGGQAAGVRAQVGQKLFRRHRPIDGADAGGLRRGETLDRVFPDEGIASHPSMRRPQHLGRRSA